MTVLERGTGIARLRRKLPEPIDMPNGRPARARLLQTIVWIAVVGACAAALVAGIYYCLIEVNWHIFYLKPWWDGTAPYHGGLGGLIRSPSWMFYRHGYRDQGEPELAFLVVGTLIAPRKTWTTRAPWWYMILAPVLLAALSALCITGLVWLLDFGIPQWAGVHALNHWWLFLGTLVGGFAIGHIVKPIWRPVGATINGWFVNWSVGEYMLRRHRRDRTKGPLKAPVWVQHWYTAPLPLRERWMKTLKYRSALRPMLPLWKRRFIPRRVKRTIEALGGLVLLGIFCLIIVGFVAHFWIGTGHTVPFLAP